MKRASWILVTGLGLVAAPAFAQQPIYPPNGETDAQAAQPQAPPQQIQPPPQQMEQPPQDEQQQMAPQAQAQPPYDDDDDDDGYDVTYDISTSPSTDQYDDGYDPNAYTQFEDTLSPYGAWQEVPSYGRVWVPSPSVVGYDFTPYGSNGHFVMTDYGWTWVSDFDWGWAPFHYGRWMVVGGRGWCWMPGTHWGPAWVDWRYGGGYVGWAPLPPRGVVIGPPRGIRSPWRFTVAGQLGVRHPAYLPGRVVNAVWNRTNQVHNIGHTVIAGSQVRFNAGPSAAMVSATIGRPISPVALNVAAPRALPRANIAPRAGVPIANRPWVQSRAVGGAFAHPAPGGRSIGNQTWQQRPAGSYQGRAQTMPYRYNAPAQPYRYNAPIAQQPYRYNAPVAQQPYRAPIAQQPYRYNAPVAQQPFRYNAPAPQPYRAPVAQQPFRYNAPAPQYRYNAPAQQQFHYNPPAAVQQYHAPAPQYHYNAPAQQFHYSAPASSYHAPTYSAPSHSYSAPAQHFSAPAMHGGGGFGAAHGSFRR